MFHIDLEHELLIIDAGLKVWAAITVAPSGMCDQSHQARATKPDTAEGVGQVLWMDSNRLIQDRRIIVKESHYLSNANRRMLVDSLRSPTHDSFPATSLYQAASAALNAPTPPAYPSPTPIYHFTLT